MLLIIYARVGLTPSYRMLILFAECWENKLLILERVENINGDLHQPSGIRYVSRSFSVRCLVSLAYRKWLIFGVNLSVVVPQAIGIYLRNRWLSKWWVRWIADPKRSDIEPRCSSSVGIRVPWSCPSISFVETSLFSLFTKGTASSPLWHSGDMEKLLLVQEVKAVPPPTAKILKAVMKKVMLIE